MKLSNDTRRIVSIYKPALALEELYPRTTRERIRLILTVAMMLGIALAFFVPVQSVLVSLAVVFVLLVLNLLLEAMYNSYYFEGMERILPEFGFPAVTNSVSIEVAEVLWKGRGNLTTGVLSARIFQKIWKRLELDPEEVSNWQTDGITGDTQNLTSLSLIASTVVENDKTFQKLLFDRGITKEAFVSAAEWVAEEIALDKERRRKWGRDALGRIPALGTDWSNARAFTLEQFGRYINETAYYSHSSSDAREIEREIESIETVLVRQSEANVLLLSEDPERALALLGRMQRHIDKGRVLSPLEHNRIFVFEARQTVALAASQHELETLLLEIFTEVAKSGNLILVIPSFSTFVLSAREAGVEIFSLLERFLSSARVKVVAIESPEGYHRELSNHPKVRELFDVLHSDFDDDAVKSLLMRSVIEYERHHNIFFTYPAVAELARALPRFFSDSILTDAIDDLLEELIPFTFGRGGRVVTKELVDGFIEQKTGIPSEGRGGDAAVLLTLEEEMAEHVIGQENALKAVAKALRRARSGVRGGRRPIGSFLFLGPTGVGKTETAKALARVFFGSEHSMVRFDMSEYQGLEALSELIGDTSGRPGVLVERLRENPYSLFLLDEFEKTSDEAKDLFLHIFDEGIFRDRNGRTVSATDAIFIATSNAASDDIWRLFKSGDDPALHTSEIIDAVVSENAFKPELINRFDGVIVFRPLSRADLQKIADIMLGNLKERLYEDQAIDLEFRPDVRDFLIQNGYDPKFGARPMRRLIQDTIEDALAEKILENKIRGGSKITLSTADFPNY